MLKNSFFLNYAPPPHPCVAGVLGLPEKLITFSRGQFFFARIRGEKGVFFVFLGGGLVLFGGVFVLLGCFFVFRAPARMFFLVFSSYRRHTTPKRGIPALATAPNHQAKPGLALGRG